MIDYEKLKLIYELCEKNSIEISYAYKKKDGEFVAWVTLDQLLVELKELKQPQSKYKTGWYVLDGRIKSTEVLNQTGYVCCDKTAVEAVGRTMYTSRDELIQEQIKHWQSLRTYADKENRWCPKFEGLVEGFSTSGVLEPSLEVGPHCRHSITSYDYETKLTQCFTCKVPMPCQHESDGIRFSQTPDAPGYKCIKCGVFYR